MKALTKIGIGLAAVGATMLAFSKNLGQRAIIGDEVVVPMSKVKGLPANVLAGDATGKANVMVRVESQDKNSVTGSVTGIIDGDDTVLAFPTGTAPGTVVDDANVIGIRRDGKTVEGTSVAQKAT
jgi:hypothetical protein